MIIKYFGPTTEVTVDTFLVKLCNRHKRQMRNAFYIDLEANPNDWLCCALNYDGLSTCDNWVVSETAISPERLQDHSNDLFEIQSSFKRFYKKHNINGFQFFNFIRFSTLISNQMINDVFERDVARPFQDKYYESAKLRIRTNFEYILEKMQGFFDHDFRKFDPVTIDMNRFPKQMLFTEEEIQGYNEWEKEMMQRLCLYLFCFKKIDIVDFEKKPSYFLLLITFFEKTFFKIQFVKEESDVRLHELLESQVIENFDMYSKEYLHRIELGIWGESVSEVFEI